MNAIALIANQTELSFDNFLLSSPEEPSRQHCPQTKHPIREHQNREENEAASNQEIVRRPSSIVTDRPVFFQREHSSKPRRAERRDGLMYPEEAIMMHRRFFKRVAWRILCGF